MSDGLSVYLDGTHIGTLAQSVGGAITFAYNDDYRRSRAATPLSLSMPLVRAAHKNKQVRAYLQGLLPDSDGRLAELGREHHVSPSNPFALLSHVGRDAAGAVQILPVGEGSPDAAQRQGDIAELDDSQFGAVVADVIANRDTWGRRESNARWSLPGAQPKVALFRTSDGTWAVPNDSTPTTHIIKPAVPPYSSHHINEFMTMSAARHLGLRVATDFMIETDRGDHAFVSERYDRVEQDGRWVRLHQEDFCQAMAVPPLLKYQKDGGPSIKQIARLFQGLPDAEDRRVNARRFYDAIVFNLAAQGTDAHAKNYSFMLDGDRASMAPLYDLGSHAPYPSRGNAPLELSMSIDGEYRMRAVGIEALVKVGVGLGLDKDEAHDRVVELTAGIVDAYRQAADDARARLGNNEFIGELVDSIENYATERGWYDKPFRT
ncbi:serine/threonine-protein kinase HipA [Homoserinimonas aerilata]|uniref:Serine/threonine-protein kinase HipA n=1 Tax=Homoserinimonas aerilata TaxID=1162970 RepID=A0A542YAA0_9MICO|nr:HipA domain-containing protein [Homoserinimonas aerilata]TQL45007.1 serine/threonine-protein kinase HipA [Homoserinimonas aerilata]